MKRVSYWLVPMAGWVVRCAVRGQERCYKWDWEMHPMWWGWGLAMMAMMFLFWALVIIGLIVGIRWLLGKAREEKSDAALQILRERYPRGEINKEEFDARKKDLL